MTEIVDIFKTTVFKENIENSFYKNYFLNLLKKEKNDKNNKIVSNVGGFQTKNLILLADKNVTENLFLKPAAKFAKMLNNKIELKLQLQNFWINSNNKNDYNLLHNHFDCNISGVYYIKVPKESGRLVFQNGDLTKLNSNNYDYFNNANFYSRYFFEINENDLYLFTSETLHYVEPNRSEKERISVAFNIKIINETAHN
jgi:uncharacterized protein (TIGR02466 family)